MPSVPNVSINQFAQTPAPAQVDLQITKAGVLTGKLSASVVGFLNAGCAVKLDPATIGQNPNFLPAADNEDAFGLIIRTPKRASFQAGDEIQVTMLDGVVIWAVANATVAPGDQLEFVTVTSGSPATSQAFAQPLASGKLRGLALDPAAVSTLFRMITLSGLVVPA